MQTDSQGCGIACIAMVTGKPYNLVKEQFYNTFSEAGMSIQDVIEYLGDTGFSIIHKYITNYQKIDFANKEMLEPFAKAHIIRIKYKFDSEVGHFVVMDEEGKIFCPSGLTDEEVKDAYAITDVIGLYDIDFIKKRDILK